MVGHCREQINQSLLKSAATNSTQRTGAFWFSISKFSRRYSMGAINHHFSSSLSAQASRSYWGMELYNCAEMRSSRCGGAGQEMMGTST